MKNFFYSKNPEKGLTTTQLKSIHSSLQNLGYDKDFSAIYSELAETCTGEYEDCALTDPKVAPMLSEKILKMLETYAQPDIRSKIFALAGLQRRQQAQVFTPTIYFTKQSVRDYLEDNAPKLLPYVDEMHGFEYLPGFGSPTNMKTESTTYQAKEESVKGLYVSKATGARLKNGKREKFEEIQKASLVVVSEDAEYEIPICRTQITSGTIDTVFETKEGIVLSEKKVMLLPEEYTKEFTDMFASVYKNSLRLP